MTYSQQIKLLLQACQFEPCRTRRRITAESHVKPLTAKERRRVESLSSERGYRRFKADYMNRL